jgi:hypothetical protein
LDGGIAGTAAIDAGRPKMRAFDNREDAGFGCSLQRRSAGSGLAALSCAFAWLLLAARRRSLRRGSTAALPPA